MFVLNERDIEMIFLFIYFFCKGQFINDELKYRPFCRDVFGFIQIGYLTKSKNKLKLLFEAV